MFISEALKADALCTCVELGNNGLWFSDLPGPFSWETLDLSILKSSLLHCWKSCSETSHNLSCGSYNPCYQYSGNKMRKIAGDLNIPNVNILLTWLYRTGEDWRFNYFLGGLLVHHSASRSTSIPTSIGPKCHPFLSRWAAFCCPHWGLMTPFFQLCRISYQAYICFPASNLFITIITPILFIL